MLIKSNHQYRNLLSWFELSEQEQSEFEGVSNISQYDFVRYKGNIYIVSDFMRTPETLSDWDGVQSDSYFSGVLIKFDTDFGDTVKMATYIS